MRIRAIVFTTVNAKDKPQLDQAWDYEAAKGNIEAVRQALTDVLMAGTATYESNATYRAAIVDIEVPDDQLLRLLNYATPTVPGAVVENFGAEQPEPESRPATEGP
ncbi:hypothetical protein SAMN04489727_1741 [Amycolatopsis tolypomycina]|uniref:Uncharacterized protein n=1 Tax=Amycolatopsis tolypomycina TaxID=208445 RepID=A0A1H4JCB6_9PSEU|nr:hypothetical protein [Amycolatopsis tolypomycina]SEB43767.1 hypothetical protein SAMN04489727_1741 [Amycolatopsis tolypomycina]